MLIKEFRITLPMTVDEYQIGQLFSVAEASRNETGGGDGVEILINEPFTGNPLLGNRYDSGQYTKKKYYLASKVGSVVRALMPKSALILEENAWNAFPYCRTILTNEYMKKDFSVTIESFHIADRGDQENVHQLSNEDLARREVIKIDIAGELMNPNDYDSSQDPAKYKSKKTERGPLVGNWSRSCSPVMTCYKLVTCEFKWFGMQNRIEKVIQNYEKRLFTNFHRQVFCWIDRWYGMTMEDIRLIEEETQKDLEKQRVQGQIQGSSASD